MLADMLAKSYVNYFCRSNLLKISSKKDNTYPLMLRLTKSGKKKYVSVGISVKEKDRDMEVIYILN